MHISEGVLSGPVLIGGGVLAVAGTAVGLKKMNYERIAQVGILSSALFISSLIHINIGPASVHLILNGIVGLLLGWMAFPSIMTALVLQAIFFQFGGITVLGVNTVNIALPALLCYFLFNPLINNNNKFIVFAASFACGSLSVFLSSVMLAASLIFTQESFWEVSLLVVTANLPVMIIEGIITLFCIAFLKKVQPELLQNY
mmetsp:Transcript_820/g.662  ORF Transcript_820/g.662 Transcript_820/m.662 type:complete len:201 (-) Transcript_820:2162-2764(-)